MFAVKLRLRSHVTRPSIVHMRSYQKTSIGRKEKSDFVSSLGISR